MARKSKGPWWWDVRGQYYVTHKGKQVPLGTDYDQAVKKWHQMEAVAATHTAGDANAFLAIAEAFLDWNSRNRKPSTYRVYRTLLSQFSRVHGKVKVADIRPFHLDDVMKLYPAWGKSKRRGFMVAISTCLNWAVKKGYVSVNPLARKLDLPVVVSRGRDAAIPVEDYELMLQWAVLALKDFLIACRHSGTRPSMVAQVTADHFNEAGECWIFDQHKTEGKTGEPLVVHLDATLLALTKRLAVLHPEGPLFLNNRGRAWKENAWVKAMIRLRKTLQEAGIALKSSGIMYGFRHAFATEMLEAGVGEAHVAALLGHKGTNMLHKHYSHLTSKHAALKAHLQHIKATDAETKAVSGEAPHSEGAE